MTSQNTAPILTVDELNALHNYWKPRLGISDWTFEIAIVRFSDMKASGRCGEFLPNLEHRNATIKILDPVDYCQYEAPIQEAIDMENNLVHELLHALFYPFDLTKQGTLEESMMEQAINSLSKTLVELRRMLNADPTH